MFAEGVAGLLEGAERVAAMEVNPKAPDRELLLAKAAAAKAIPQYRAVLYPEDDDG